LGRMGCFVSRSWDCGKSTFLLFKEGHEANHIKGRTGRSWDSGISISSCLPGRHTISVHAMIVPTISVPTSDTEIVVVPPSDSISVVSIAGGA